MNFLVVGQDPQRKASSVQKPEFDIAEAMAKRKPLRKTSTALVMHSKQAAKWVGVVTQGVGGGAVGREHHRK